MERAKNIIPGGNMLLSKRPEMYLLLNGLPIFLKQKDVMFGTSKIKYLDFLRWGWCKHSWL